MDEIYQDTKFCPENFEGPEIFHTWDQIVLKTFGIFDPC